MTSLFWLFSIFIFLNFLLPSRAFYQNGSFIHDLQTTTTTYGSNTLTSDANNWTLSNSVCPSCSNLFNITTSMCTSASTIFGGPNILGPAGASTYGEYYERQYQISNDLPWNVSILEFQVSVFTSTVLATPFKPSSYMAFKINDLLIEPRDIGYYTSCEKSYNDSSGIKIIKILTIDIKYIYAYSGTNSFNLKIVSRFTDASTLHSLAVKDVKIRTINTPFSGYTNFPCDTKFYFNGSTCAPCHSYCSSCSGLTNNQCSSCVLPKYNYKNGSCLDDCPTTGPLVQANKTSQNYCEGKCSSGYYWAYNDSCSPTCDLPFKKTTVNSIQYCSTPCADPNQYLYPNGSCLSTCNGPLSQSFLNGSSIRLCTNPCKNDNGSISFLFPNGTCNVNCPSPLFNKTESNIKYCYTPCTGAQYLYPNRTCSATCPSPLVPVIELNTGGFTYCTNPCQSGGGNSGLSPPLFLYPNNTCHTDCQAPLLNRTETNIKYCYTPCQSNQYLYKNGSCSAACNLPLMPKVEPNTFNFCINPCLYSDTLFLFPDGTCNNTCPLPLFSRTENSGKYCENPCADNKTFLHENLRVCQETCPAPNLQRNQTYASLCKFPCDNPDHYYHTMEKQCKATCEYPQQAQETPLPKLCISSLSEEEVKQVQQMANAASTAGTASDTGLMIFSVISSSDSTSACMGPLAKMLQYIRFMDIMYPEKVVLMLQEQAKNANKGGFTQKILGSVIDTFPNHKLNGRFNTYNARSNFFVNFWPSLFNLLVILLVTMLISSLTRWTKDRPKIHGILKNLTDVVKWNVFLITFCGSIGDIVLFTALEFQTLEFDNFQAVFSFVLCLVINAVTFFIFMKILNVNSNIRESKKSLNNEHKKQIEQQFTSYRALFECYKEYSYYQQIFLFVFILRLAIFNAVIGYFYNSPLFQATISTLLNILMLGYLVVKRPMKKLVNLIQQIVLELVLLPFNICVLALAIMDHQEILEIEHRKGIGNVIFYTNLITPMLSLVLMAAKFAVMGFELYRSWKASKAQKTGRHKEIELSPTKTIMNSSIEEQFSIQQNLNLPFDSSTCKILSDNTQILDLADNSTTYPESHMSNSRLSCPGVPKMKIKRARRFGNHHHQQPNLMLNVNLDTQINLQTSHYYPQLSQLQQQQHQDFSSIPLQQEEMFENIEMTQSTKIDDNIRGEQDIQIQTDSLQDSRASKLNRRIFRVRK